MAKITEKQLIENLKALKEIKPNQEWATLLKSQILSENTKFEAVKLPAEKFGILETISSVFFQKKFVYSFAAFAFVIVGLIGFAQSTVPGDLLFPVRKISEQSTAALSGKAVLKQDVATLNNRINDLAQVAKQGKKDNVPSAISEISTNVSALAKALKENPVNDPETIKDIADGLKVLASVPGTDLSENPDVIDLYKTVVQSQIEDIEKTTLTAEQKEIMAEVRDLYDNGKYLDALEKILLINKEENIQENNQSIK
jgi:hypothetical protein